MDSEKKRSCYTQLLGVFHDIGEALDSGKEADMIYLDFSKAFDSVSHLKLLLKLQQHGISGLLLNWISDYLSNRRQTRSGQRSRIFLPSCHLGGSTRKYTWSTPVLDLCKLSYRSS
ncbi:Hypothetical predicted protein [Paramuricea clavata]|uniref:Uncharacterized protein n=1 Tax=Paramuricea clavata TaxID=317549 RepID=A0A7D9J3Z0_PARCT|nr:Hypothetical predicted protein [Paramuricea clavata]